MPKAPSRVHVTYDDYEAKYVLGDTDSAQHGQVFHVYTYSHSIRAKLTTIVDREFEAC